MKRLLGAVLLVVLAAAAGLTSWAGVRSKAAYRDLVQALSSQPSVRVLETSYHSGWLHSRAKTSFEVHGAPGAAFRNRLQHLGSEDVRGRVGLRTTHAIDHGPPVLWQWLADGAAGAPVVARIASRIELDNESQLELAAVLGRLPALLATTEIRLSEEGASEFVMPARPLEPRRGKRTSPLPVIAAHWGGLEGQLLFTLDPPSLAGQLRSAGFESRGQEWRFAISDLESRFDAAPDPSGIWVGSVRQRLGSATFAPAEAERAFELGGLDIHHTSRVSAGRFEARLELALERLSRDGERYGPGRAALALRDLDARALVELQRVLGSPGPVGDGDGGTPIRAAALLPALATHSPVLELATLRLATPEGTLEARAHLALDGSDPERLAHPLAAATAIEAAFEFSCPAAAFDALVGGEAVLPLEEQGLVVRENGRVHSRIDFRRGVLSANGEPVPDASEPDGSSEVADASPAIP